MKTNLAKNEEKLAKKVALLGKYESKKEKLSTLRNGYDALKD